MKFNPLNTRGLAEEVFDTLREKVLLSELKPGDKLDVATMALNMGVSRTPVKEALQKLAMLGLIEVHPRKGTFVAVISARHLVEVTQIKDALEIKACELAASRIEESTLSLLRTLNQRLQSVTTITEYLVLERQFHRAIVNSAKNARLARLYTEVQAEVEIGRAQVKLAGQRNRALYQEHVAILEALAKGDAATAVRQMALHLTA